MTTVTFDTPEGTFNIPDYYKKKYSINITKLKQPLVAV
jgi:FPC/CPF motif-containing protein YcgG